MLKNLTELRTEWSRLHSDSTAVIAAAEGENRELTTEEQTANDTRYNRIKAIQKLIDEDARFAALAMSDDTGDNDDDTKPAKVQKPKDPPGRDEYEANSDTRVTVRDRNQIDRAEFSRALNEWALTGSMNRKFATITTATASGALLPKTIATPLVPVTINAFREAHQIYGLTPVETDTAENLTIPVMDASAGGVVAENASSETENAPSLAESIVLNASMYQSGTAWFSNLQLAATGFDLVSYITTDLVQAKELGLEAAIAAGIIADAGVTQAVTSGATTTFDYGDLVALNRALPKKYDRSKVIVLGAAAYAYAEGLTDSAGRPILMQDPQNQELKRFNGTPVVRSDNFEAMSADNVIGCVVSMLGFRLRDVRRQEVQRYTQSPARPAQTGFNLFAPHGYGYAPSAVAKFKTAAS